MLLDAILLEVYLLVLVTRDSVGVGLTVSVVELDTLKGLEDIDTEPESDAV